MTASEKPILFSGPMVAAILEGRKTQTRRKMDLKNALYDPSNILGGPYEWLMMQKCPYPVGTKLWVRENYAVGACADGYRPSELSERVWKVENGGLWYPADGTEPKTPISPRGRTRSGRFMVRWASRLTLEVTDVRVQRLQDISQEDAIAEGVQSFPAQYKYGLPTITYRDYAGKSDICRVFNARASFQTLWKSINGAESWSADPWVWAYTFRREG